MPLRPGQSTHFHAWSPVRMGSDPATPAAAYAARQTGGVTLEYYRRIPRSTTAHRSWLPRVFPGLKAKRTAAFQNGAPPRRTEPASRATVR